MLLSQWDFDANGTLTPQNVTVGSSRKIHWRCENGHAWEAKVYSRTEGRGCPYCSGQKPVPGESDLATLYPQIAAEWDYAKNGALTPASVTPGSHRKVHWRCSCGHEWETPIHRRVYNETGCPYCAGSLPIPGKTDLAAQRPEIAAEWDYAKNVGLTPQDVLPGSERSVWWLCPKGHSYSASVRSRGVGGTGCPYCAGRKILPGFNDLATKFPKIAAQWHPTLNGGLTPAQVGIGCNRKIWWICPEQHVWQAKVYSRTGKDKCGCPVCAGQIKKAKLYYYDKVSQDYYDKVSQSQDWARSARPRQVENQPKAAHTNAAQAVSIG